MYLLSIMISAAIYVWDETLENYYQIRQDQLRRTNDLGKPKDRGKEEGEREREMSEVLLNSLKLIHRIIKFFK